MDAINKLLQDPSWWFSAVVIAIVASILAGFTKDWLEKRYGLFISWSSSKRRLLKSQREAIIAAWSASESLLTIALLKMLFWITGHFALLIMGALYVTYLRLKYNFVGLPNADDLPAIQIAKFAFVTIAISIYSFKVARIVFITADMLTAFRKLRSLPKFAE